MNTVGAFTIIKNEIPWIEAHLKSWLPHLDQMCMFDGNSTDGTLEVLRRYSMRDSRVTLVEDKDPANLQQAYVDMFNECLRTLDTDFAIFLHPDMICIDPGLIRILGSAVAYFTNIDSFAGNPGEQLYKVKGRAEKWKNVYRLRNPDLGLHYHGFYGAANEDCYFRAFTEDSHEFYGTDFERYPYPVLDSGIKLNHYSDVRTYERRLGRMKQCLLNQGYPLDDIDRLAKAHPRVSLQSTDNYKLEPATYPEVFAEAVR